MPVKFFPNRIKPFDAAFDGNIWDFSLAHFLLNRGRHVVEKSFVGRATLFELRRQLAVIFRMKIFESQIFQFTAQLTHAQAMRNGRIDVHSLLGNAAPFIRVEELQRAHVVEAIGELDQDDAHVINHCEQHLSHIFRLLFFARHVADVGDFG